PDFVPGSVWLVGAGPGDPGLLTALALHALANADVIVYDALVDRRVLALKHAAAALDYAGKRGGRPSAQQEDISLRLVRLAREGRRVLRLKGGDPFVFGRGGEEAIALKRAGVPFRVRLRSRRRRQFTRRGGLASAVARCADDRGLYGYGPSRRCCATFDRSGTRQRRARRHRQQGDHAGTEC